MPKSELTRRKLLAGLAAAGGAGAGVGTGTSALLTDDVDGFGATLAAGTLDLNVACSGDNCTETEDGTVSLTPTIQSGYGGDENVEVSSDLALRLDDDSNPAYVWMRIGCVDIDEENDLAEMLHLTITFDDENELLDKPLMDIGGDVERLIPVGDEDTLLPERGEGNPYPLSFTWELAENDGEENSVRTSRGGQEGDEFENDLEVDLPVEFKAVQSRHTDLETFQPFSDSLSCDGSVSCNDCNELPEINKQQIKKEFEGKKDITSVSDGHDYTISILDMEETDHPDSHIQKIKFKVEENDSPVPVCQIKVDNANKERIYDDKDPEMDWIYGPEKNSIKRIKKLHIDICADYQED